jgi:hypothetical protein
LITRCTKSVQTSTFMQPLAASARVYFMWRVRQAARPESVLGEVMEIRRGGLWALQAARILVLTHESHRTRSVRMQVLKPGTTILARPMPEEAIRVASLLRRAAKHSALDDAEPSKQRGA